MLTLQQKLKLSGFAVGIIASFGLAGLAGQQIFKERYGNEIDPATNKTGEIFTMPMTFGLLEAAFFALVAKVLIVKTHHPASELPRNSYALAALFLVGAKYTANYALQKVPYPTQVVGKAAKPIPVMLFGFFLGGKTYTLRKVMFVIIIVIGVAVFIYEDKKKKLPGEDLIFGTGLIIVSLIFDGLCAAKEERMRSVAKPTALHFMFYLSLWSTIYHAIGVMAICELPKFNDFVTHHPEIIKYIVANIVCTTFGQLFIMSMLSSFGALPVSIATTTRKLFTVILSVIFYPDERITLQKWIAVAVVFGTLLLDGVLGKKMEVRDTPQPVTDMEKQPQDDKNMLEENGNCLRGIHLSEKSEILL